MSMPVIDMENERVGRLFVMKRSARKEHSAYWVCRCDCGKLIEVSGTDLRRSLRKGQERSCGCARHNPDAEIRRAYTTYRHNAKSRYLAFDLSLESFTALVLKACTYCGATPEVRTDKRSALFKTRRPMHGVDRIAPELGYIEGNVVPCCEYCNVMKWDRSFQAFLKHCKRIVSHLS
jgi:hypothetical protein